MLALCIEASHARGLGHLFRAVNLVRRLQRGGRQCSVLVNAYEPAIVQLAAAGVAYRVVDVTDVSSDWEGRAIAQLGVRLWVNDRLDTTRAHGENVVQRGIPIVTFDDRGTGAGIADLNIAALAVEPDELLPGRRVLRGLDYLVLDETIRQHRRLRRTADRLLVTLGGSDTHGVTVTVVETLKRMGRAATVVTGPGFAHDRALADAASAAIEIKRSVPSLIAELAAHDVAITAGGITACEAAALGVPCLIVATEPFEVPVAKHLERMGAAVCVGYRRDIDIAALDAVLPVEAMSRAGLEGVDAEGGDRVAGELLVL